MRQSFVWAWVWAGVIWAEGSLSFSPLTTWPPFPPLSHQDLCSRIRHSLSVIFMPVSVSVQCSAKLSWITHGRCGKVTGSLEAKCNHVLAKMCHWVVSKRKIGPLMARMISSAFSRVNPTLATCMAKIATFTIKANLPLASTRSAFLSSFFFIQNGPQHIFLSPKVWKPGYIFFTMLYFLLSFDTFFICQQKLVVIISPKFSSKRIASNSRQTVKCISISDSKPGGSRNLLIWSARINKKRDGGGADNLLQLLLQTLCRDSTNIRII